MGGGVKQTPFAENKGFVFPSSYLLVWSELNLCRYTRFVVTPMYCTVNSL